MAYRFDVTAALERTIKDVAEQQWAKVETGLATLDVAAVHDTRKAIKRLRALVSAVAPRTRDRAGLRLDRALRDLGRSLSATRDRDVLQSLWEQVGGTADPDLYAAGFVSIAAVPLGPAYAPEDRHDLARRAAGCLADMEFGRIDRDAVIAAVGLAYRDARHLQRRAERSGEADAFHDWRKAVQRHWRHMQLLAQLWPEEMAARVAAARALSADLGEANDCAVLLETLRGAARTRGTGRAWRRLMHDLERQMAERRLRAAGLGRLLYAERPKAFERRLQTYADLRWGA